MRGIFQKIRSCLITVPFLLSTLSTEELWPNSIELKEQWTTEQIIIQGNKRTRGHLILQQMRFRMGNPADSLKLGEARRRIQNLGLFSRVAVKTKEDTEGKRLIVQAKKKWYISPSPIFFVNEGDWDKRSYGARIIHKNFSGIGDHLQGSFWLGYRPGISLSYNSRHFYLGLRYLRMLTQFQLRMKNINLRYESHNYYQWIIGSITKKLSHHIHIILNLSHRFLLARPFNLSEIFSLPTEMQIPDLEILLGFDSRDVYNYPRKGSLGEVRIKKSGWRKMGADGLRYGVDLRKYLPLAEGISLALRGKVDLCKGKISGYDWMSLWYANRIRGHFYERVRGENLIIGGIELRSLIIKPGNFLWKKFPLLKRYAFGISGGFFSDVGAVWLQKESLSLKKLNLGYGPALHFHLPYLGLLRIGYALNEDLRGEVFLDTRVAF